MASGDKVLDLIKQFLSGSDQTDRPEMREAARQYADACTVAKEGLRACDELLSRGLLSDAIAKAESYNPSLLHMIRKLNFKEHADWLTFCLDYGWQVPPELDMDAVDRLEKAYRNAEAMRPLLEQWREIVRTGSIQSRLALARRIVALDPTNTAWRQNVVELERDVLATLIEEAKHAIENQNCERLKDIHQEIFHTGFSIQPEERVTRKIETVLKQYRKECLRRDADALVRSINEAYGMGDQNQLSGLLEKWDGLLHEEDFTPTGQELSQIGDARAWLENKLKEAAHAQEVIFLNNSLTDALERELPLPEIENLYYRLRQTGTDISPVLEERVRCFRENWELNQNRRHRLRMILAVAGAFAILISLFGGGWLYQKFRTESEAVSSVNKALSDGRPELALQLIDQYMKTHPGENSGSEILRLKAEAEKQKQERSRRNAEFNRIQNEFAALKQIDNLPARITQAEELRQKAAEYADPLNPEHQSRLAEMVKIIALDRHANQNSIDTRFITACGKISDNLSGIENMREQELLPANILEIKKRFAGVSADVARLTAAEGVTQSIKDEELRRIDSRMAADRKWMNMVFEIAELKSKLENSLSLSDFEVFLKRYHEACRRMPGKKMEYAEAPDWFDFYRGIGALDASSDIKADDFQKGFPFALKMVIKGNTPENCVWYADLIKLQQLTDNMKSLSPELVAATIRQAETDIREMGDSYRGWFEMRLKKNNCYYWLYTKTQSKIQFKQPGINRQVIGPTDCKFIFYPILEKDTVPYKMIFTAQAKKVGSNLFTIRMQPVDNETEISENTLRLLDIGAGYSFDNITPSDLAQLPEAQHYTESVKLVRGLGKLATGNSSSSPEKEVADQIRILLEDTSMHPYPRLKMIARLVKLLREISPRYAELLTPAAVALSQTASQECDWLQPVPVDSADYQTKIERWQNLPNEKLKSFMQFLARGTGASLENEHEIAFLVTALSRQLKAVAVIVRNAKNRPSVRLLNEPGSKIGELWMLRKGARSLEFVIVSEPDKGECTLDPEYAKEYFEGRILFAPADGKSTRDLAIMLSLPYPDKNAVKWPASWPVNRKGK